MSIYTLVLEWLQTNMKPCRYHWHSVTELFVLLNCLTAISYNCTLWLLCLWSCALFCSNNDTLQWVLWMHAMKTPDRRITTEEQFQVIAMLNILGYKKHQINVIVCPSPKMCSTNQHSLDGILVSLWSLLSITWGLTIIEYLRGNTWLQWRQLVSKQWNNLILMLC